MIKLPYKTVIPTRVTLTLNPPLHAHVSTTGLFMTTDLRTAKKDLRKTIRAKLSHLPGESIAAQSAVVTELVLSLPEYQKATRLGVYLSMPRGEVSTNTIVLDALEQGKKLFVPYISKTTDAEQRTESYMELVSVESKEDYEGLPNDNWGIPSPGPESIAGRDNALRTLMVETGTHTDEQAHGLDLILMPGMAFDHDLRRLGHGKGFYDRYLSQYRALVLRKPGAKVPVLVGLALQEQVLELGDEIPADANDWRLNKIISPKEMLE